MKEYTPLDDLTNDYLTCRALRHAWEENPHGQLDTAWTQEAFAVVMLRCVRCGTEGYDFLGADLVRIVPRRYVYPDGYKKITLEDWSRPALYGELLKRSFLVQQINAKPRKRR